jgi:hypothetical protein
MSSRNGMDGLSEAPPKHVRYTWDEMVSRLNPELHGLKRKRPADSYTPNLARLHGPTMKEIVKDRHVTYFFIKDYTGFGDGDEWHAVLDYIEMVFTADRTTARVQIWDTVRKKKAVQGLTKYVKKCNLLAHDVELVLYSEEDKNNSMTAVMTKLGLQTFLKSYSPPTNELARYRDCAVEIMAQLIAEDAPNIEDAAAQTASSVQEDTASSRVINDTESESDVEAYFIHTST